MAIPAYWIWLEIYSQVQDTNHKPLGLGTPLAELEVSRSGWHEPFQSNREREELSVVELLNVPMEWQALNTFNAMLKYAYRALYPCRVTSRSSVRLVS